MNLFSTGIEEGLELARRVDPQYLPAWKNKSPAEQAAMAMYFLPHGSKKEYLCPTRPGLIKWYCPFADQKSFPSGHRYCINVYTGCSHACEYCYAAGYEPSICAIKNGFAKLLQKDLADIEYYDVPAAPIHLSNSTDPFQPLESQAGHARLALREILHHRQRFTSVVVLTKNPNLAVKLDCMDLFLNLAESSPAGKEFYIEVSLAFWRDEPQKFYEPGSPSITDRIEGIRLLRRAGVPVVLRVDPLFPRMTDEDAVKSAKFYDNFGLPEPQTLKDLERLVGFGAETGVHHVVYSPAKIVQPRTRVMSAIMQQMLKVYEDFASPRRLTFRGGSWRLPPDLQSATTGPLIDICRKYSVPAKCCKQNLIETT